MMRFVCILFNFYDLFLPYDDDEVVNETNRYHFQLNSYIVF